jgi:Na+-translocating ferredoxin:NAD+ oxidoreductase RnfG subunit
MTFKFKIKIGVVLMAFMAFKGHAALLQTDEKALHLAYPQAEHFAARALTLTAVERQVIEAHLGKKIYSSNFTIYDVSAAGKKAGRAIHSQELGKHQPMDTLVALDPAGKVIDLELLSYRETYGGQVAQEKFRSQFKDKGLRDRLDLGRNIDAVSGATISSKSMILSVRKALMINALIESGDIK